MNLKQEILKNEVPSHVAIIMDGNRRWAKKNRLLTSLGHREGVKRLMEVVESSIDLGIKSLTVYAFSTENWGREKMEVDCLMGLLSEFIKKELKRINENNIKLNLLGNIDDLPKKVKDEVNKSLEVTKNNTKFNFNIALSYGGRNEIIKAVKKVVKDVNNNIISIEDINEDSFRSYLYTHELSDPDFLIRTSGEIRLSNFLLYQMAYTEFYFTDVLWPEFKEHKYFEAILEYQNRNRRFGKK